VKTIGEIVTGREPSATEAGTLAHVLEVARAWERGDLPLAGVRSTSSGYERWTAIRFAGIGNPDKVLLMRLQEALVRDAGDVMTKQGLFTQDDLREAGAWIHPDDNGRRVIRFKGMDDQGRAYFREIPDYKLAEGAR
jgi:hypothetical protein